MHGTVDWSESALPPCAAQAIFIQGMFAWLHRPKSNWGGDVAVLVCSALSRDAVDSHRFLRVLADDFAAAGYPVLRFDYPGTGDSCDFADTPSAEGNLWAAWQESVQIAADALLAATGAKHLILCGLRIGATLAALAAEKRSDVDGLILLAPVIRGQSYIRQLWIEAGLQEGETRKLQEGFALQNLNFTPDTVHAIAHADLRTIHMPAGRRIAICAQSQSAPLLECESQWKEQGADLQLMNFEGLESLLTHRLEGEIAPADFGKLLLWAKQSLPPRPAFYPAVLTFGAPLLQRRDSSETPIQFGPSNKLFGMLCEPNGQQKDIVVILCGGGRDPHYGIGSSAVRIAQNLAQDGFASLRIDFSGLGDSIGPTGRETMMTEVFESRICDISAAIDKLQMLGFRRFAVQGLCSGAYHAFHAALSEPRIGMLLLINMPIFVQTNDTGHGVLARASRPWLYYLRQVTDIQSWRRLLGGRCNLSSIFRGRLLRMVRQGRQWIQASLHADAENETNFARCAIKKLSQNSVKIFFLFGPDELGLLAIDENFGPKGIELSKFACVTLQFAERFDHGMTQPHTQVQASRALIAQLQAWKQM